MKNKKTGREKVMIGSTITGWIGISILLYMFL